VEENNQIKRKRWQKLLVFKFLNISYKIL
jgi:hypothetical protein